MTVDLLAVIPSTGIVIEEGTTLNFAPRELLLRFSNPIDSDSLDANGTSPIQFERGGDDGTLGTGNDDVTVTPGFIGIGENPNDVIVRFEENLPDDVYQMTIVGSEPDPLRDTSGDPFMDGQDLERTFTLDLGAQVVAVVPQPITRDPENPQTGALDQAVNRIDVYFNKNDPLDMQSAENEDFYQLIRTNGTATTEDDEIFNPIPGGVTYSSATGRAQLTFETDVLMTAGTYRLRIGTEEPRALAPFTPTITFANGLDGPGTSFEDAALLGPGGNPFPADLGTQTILLSDEINHVPTPVVLPGSPDEPGERDPIIERHVTLDTNTGPIPVISYNFQTNYGTVGGQPRTNLITAPQRARVREAFSYYSQFLGVQFVETVGAGLTIARGDVRAINPDAAPNGLDGLADPVTAESVGTGRAVINSLIDWGASEPGGEFFQAAMRQIGHLLGLGTNFAAPALTVQGFETTRDSEDALGTSLDKGEPVFPGDLDILYGRFVWPALGNDINVYKFNLANAGRINIETIAERLRSLDLDSTPSQLDSVISVYDAAGTLISRNDDYFGKDSFVQLELSEGEYFVAITSTGNTNFDPVVGDSGFGGTTQGEYQLRITFSPTTGANDGIRDQTGTRLDGDRDGLPGGVSNFWFQVDMEHTLFVDKVSTGGPGELGSITNPYTTIAGALGAAASGSIVRIVGNGGTDGKVGTLGDNRSYNIGFNASGGDLSDGTTFNLPRGVTVMIDPGSIIKLRAANINVGSFEQGIDRSEAALQVLGTPATDADGLDIGTVHFTSFYNRDIGDKPASGILAKGNWGGLVFRADSDLEADGIFLNYVNHASLSRGGGQVGGPLEVFAPIHLETARPTITYNTIINSADSVISADPDSFEETEFLGPDYHADYTRVGPRVYGNTLSENSINALFIRVVTNTSTEGELNPLSVNARLANTDIVHVLKETLLITGQAGGLDGRGTLTARPSARLALDPGLVLKMGGGRIETGIGAQFIAEGTIDRPIIMTSVFDDRFGASGTSDTTNDGNESPAATPAPADWAGIFFGPLSTGSIDHALVAFGGGTGAIEGSFVNFNPVEIHQAQVRITNSTFDRNNLAAGSERAGRGPSDESVIFIRGAQPVILENTFINNFGSPSDGVFVPNDPQQPNKVNKGAVISVNVNALNSERVDDWGRSRGEIDFQGPFSKNTGPLIRNNRVGNNTINGMIVRGGTITTNVIWDDTDMVHVVTSSIQAPNQQSLSGTLRLQSNSAESLVVKLLGTNTDLIASGSELDVTDRTGGSLQIVGTPDHPVVITSLKDDTAGAGLTPDGLPQTDTLNRKGVVDPEPPLLPTSGPVILDAAARDVHGSDFNGPDDEGWDTLGFLVNYVQSTSQNRPEGRENVILYLGWYEPPPGSDLSTPYSREAIDFVAQELGLTVEYAGNNTNEIGGVNFNNYSMVYVPTHSFGPPFFGGAGYPLPISRAQRFQDTDWFGGIEDFHLAQLKDRQDDLLDYINNQGGGLLVMAQDTAANPYAFLGSEEHPFIVRESGGNVMTATAEAPANWWPNFNINDTQLNEGTPYRAAFKGSTGFNRLEPWAVDPVTGEIAMLGLAAGGPGVGPPRDVVAPADWGSIRLDVLSNDRNVEIINETERGFPSGGDANRLPSTAQFLGELAKDQVSGDESIRLGFEVHGGLSQATDSAGGADVDVYSFRGTAGTRVWIDIDRTATSLDSLVELIDANGVVIARSDDSVAESAGTEATVGSASPMELGALTGSPSPFATPDFYTSNPKDAGMRVNLPGTAGTINTYFVRVRSKPEPGLGPDPLSNLTGGLTEGAYVLQLRLQNRDEFAGSTVRYADVRYATNGVEVIGKPENTPLRDSTSELNPLIDFFSGAGTSFSTAQDIGNLLSSPQGEINVSGTIDTQNEVQWFRMDLNFDLIESLAGFTDGLRTFATMFAIQYTDGLSRPDTTISVFDDNGNLILIGRDSDIADAQPRPAGSAANLSQGSFGTLDAAIGTVQLPAGVPGANAGQVSYFIAVSSAATMPTILDATFQMNATDPLVRLEPINSVARVADDRIGSTGDTTAEGSRQLFPGDTPQNLNLSAVPYTLEDVVLFVMDGSDLVTVNPFTGRVNTFVTDPTFLPQIAQAGQNLTYNDIALRDDGRFYTFADGLGNNNTAATNGTYTQFSPSDGTLMQARSNPIATFELDDDEPVDPTTGLYNYVPVNNDPGVEINAMAFSTDSWLIFRGLGNVSQNEDTFRSFNSGRMLFTVGNRSAGNGIRDTQNLLIALDADTGAPLDVVTNTNRYPPPDGVTYTAFQPNNSSAVPQAFPTGPAESGTAVVPRGTLNTGVFLMTPAGSASLDGATFDIGRDTFEMDTNNDLIVPNAIPVPFNVGDSANDIAKAIAAAIVLPDVMAEVQVDTDIFDDIDVPENVVKIGGDTFSFVDARFETDSRFGSSPDITGLAFLPRISADLTPDLFAVSEGGGVYRVTNYGDFVGFGQNTNDAELTLLNVIDSGHPVFGGNAFFSGLTEGPSNVEGGRFGRTLFATDSFGTLYAMDSSGQPAPVFVDDQTSVFAGIVEGGQSFFNFNFDGLAFSPLDYNLWHVTETREFDPGHGVTPSFDFDSARNSENPNAPPPGGDQSFYFGLEDRGFEGATSPFLQPGALNFQSRPVTNQEILMLSGNPSLFGSYNLPGGAHGSLQTSFSLEGYSASDKPTLYFNYALDTEGENSNETDMRDSFRVYARAGDGGEWLQLVTNNSVLSATTVADAELPAFPSVSGGNYRGAGEASNQRVQEAFDAPGVPNPTPINPDNRPYMRNGFDEDFPTLAVGWRQARVDLGDLAGEADVQLRFDFSTAGSMDEGLQGDQFGLFNTPYRVVESPTIPGVFSEIIEPFQLGRRRGQNNAHQGVFIDDVIVGLAGRGEMVTGHFDPVQQLLGQGGGPGNTSFFALPRDPLPGGSQEILTGDFQLAIRRGTEYATLDGGVVPFITLNDTFDVNDRFAPGFTLVAPAAAQIVDGETFTIDDGTRPLVFEFDTNGQWLDTDPNRVQVFIANDSTAGEVANTIRDAINGAFASEGFRVSASTTGNGNRVDLFDAFTVEVNGALDLLTFGVEGGDTGPGLGDVNRNLLSQAVIAAPGQTIIHDNQISNVRQVGIQVIPKIGQINENGSRFFTTDFFQPVAFTQLYNFPIGVPSSKGGIATLPTANTRGWVPGVTVSNNLVVSSGRTGIQVGGDPNASYAYAQRGNDDANFFRETELFLPFVRVVNNTVYDAKNGIAASNASSPTIVNNIVANSGVTPTPVIQTPGAAIFVDDASGGPKPVPAGLTIRFGDTVVSANLYKENAFNVLGTGDTNSFSLSPDEPLFVDAANGNFYLADRSRAIDSSVNTVQERNELLSVTSPLGFPSSPIQSPSTDIFGQLRVDDPSVASPPGLGSNVFKDRGAVERADFIGPTATVVNPVDNDPRRIDRNPLPDQLLLVNRQLTGFSIQLLDGIGIGIDDTSVLPDKVTVERTIDDTTTTLVRGVNYVFSYDTNSKTIRLTPTQGIWSNGIYTITLDNTDDSGIRDVANNILQPNVPPDTQFVIELTDSFTSGWQNPNNKFDVDDSGFVSGRDLLLIVNRILTGQSGVLPPVPVVPPFIDVSGDGALSVVDALQVVNFILTSQLESAAPAVTTATTLDAESPNVEPATANTNSDPVAVGLAMSDASSRVELEDDLWWEPSPGASDALPVTATAANAIPQEDAHRDQALAATLEPDELDALDSELDSILTDLTGDLPGGARV